MNPRTHTDTSASRFSWTGKRVLVTGGAGFVGSHLADGLVSRGARVRVLDNLTSGSEANIAQIRSKIDFHQGDLRDAQAVDAAVEGCDAIFHLGANASVPNSVDDRQYDFMTNAQGTYHVGDAAIRHEVERIVYASTAAVYGAPQYTPVDEQHPLNPVSPYGGTKLAGERLLFAYAKVFGFSLSIVRIFNTYGPRQRHYVSYDLMMKLARDPTRLEVLGSGNQRRDYCYISDMVSGLILAGEVATNPPEVFNLSGGRTVTIRELVTLILKTLDLRDTEVSFGKPSWKGDIEVLSGDIRKIREKGWEPSVSMEEGLRHMATSLDMFTKLSAPTR